MNPFETTILKLKDLGFFQFVLPFMLSAAIIYGLLRKTQLFGPSEKNVAVNATVALAASFFVWAYPILMGVNLETQFSTFMMQGIGVILAMTIVFLISGMFFPPDLPKTISEKFKSAGIWGVIIVGAIILVFILLVSSGLYQVFVPKGTGFNISNDTWSTLGVVLLLVGAVAAIILGTK